MKHARALWLGSVLLLSLPLLILIATGYSETGKEGIVVAMRFLFSLAGIGDIHPEHEILKLRLLRALCAAGVGGSLALAGAMTQGLFRNPLAEPGLLGIGSGASLGAVIAIAMLGGYGPDFWSRTTTTTEPGIFESYYSLGLIPIMAFCGALASAFTIYRLATRSGRISVPMLLLTGLAINSLLGAMMAGLQVLLLQDWQVSRAIISWGFGTLDDRSSFHVTVVACGAVLALISIPFVGLELDLMSGGEEDAAALGADPARVKTLVLACVALATAAAVSVSGQIAFVGLLVPHVTRSIVGPHHRALLPASFLAGATLLVLVVVLQHAAAPIIAEQFQGAGHLTLANIFTRLASLQPGVVTSLMGAPFFLALLLRQGRRELGA
ncbi:MAG TPA: iron ABC transporter permease [Planctomycetota bacterium]|nr:iron ABC transporter permease [Planctomycetota bacterium]